MPSPCCHIYIVRTVVRGSSPEHNCISTVQRCLLQCLLPLIEYNCILWCTPCLLPPKSECLSGGSSSSSPVSSRQQAAARLWLAQVGCPLQQRQQLSCALWQQPVAMLLGFGSLVSSPVSSQLLRGADCSSLHQSGCAPRPPPLKLARCMAVLPRSPCGPSRPEELRMSGSALCLLADLLRRHSATC